MTSDADTWVSPGKQRELLARDLHIPLDVARAALAALNSPTDAKAQAWLRRGHVDDATLQRVLDWVKADLEKDDRDSFTQPSPVGGGRVELRKGQATPPAPGGGGRHPIPPPAATHVLSLPPGYDDATQRGKLIKLAHERLGDGDWQLRSLPRDPATGAWLATVTTEHVDPLDGVQQVELAETVKPGDAPRVAAWAAKRGFALVRWSPFSRAALLAPLPPFDAALRRRVAARLGAGDAPWEVELTTRWTVDERSGEGRVAEVTISRYPVIRGDHNKVVGVFRDEVVPVVPGGSAGWSVAVDHVSGTVTLCYGVPPVLPARVELADLVPDRVRPEDWAQLILGVGVGGPEDRVGLDLEAGPHALIAGPVGSGKSVCLVSLAVAALARGHQLVVVDPVKAGLDFVALRPWASAWADDLATGQAVMEAIYTEVARRKSILQAHGAVRWDKLPLEVGRRERIKPVIAIIDEYSSLVLQEPVPKGLPKDHQYVVDAQGRNASREIIAALTGRIAREARFAGIHLAIASQRPDAGIVSGELRANLASAVQLAPPGKPLSREALTMTMQALAAEAGETLSTLDDGHSRGLAVVAAEGGSVRGLRVAYATPADIPELITRLGVPPAEPWLIQIPEPEDDPWEIQIPVPAEPAVHDVGEMEFSLDDLHEYEDSGDDPAPADDIWGDT